ncbi:hypothetical protein ACHAXS_005892 [Conticribra weissflogii]
MTIMSIENTAFHHSVPPVAVALVEDDTSCSSSSSSSSPSSTASPVSLHIPHPHHQLFLPQEYTHVEYAHLKCPEAYQDDDDDDDDLHYFDADSSSSSTSYSSALSSTCCRGERRYQQRWNGSGGSSSEKLSSVKQRGGGSWLLGFARIQQQQQQQQPQSVQVQLQVDDEEGLVRAHKGQEREALPGLVRSNSSSSLGSSSTSTSSSSSSSSSKPAKKGVSFNTSVLVRPIPHSSTYTSLQKKKMYASSQEVRANKIRNKKEYRFDGYDWRNATEEWEMSVCMLTGELIHPAHTFEMK